MNQNGILVDLYSIDFFDFPHTLGLATSGKWWFSLYLLCSAHWNLSYSLLSAVEKRRVIQLSAPRSGLACA